jgi:MtaA/CmuA family methyltransferase
MTGKQRALAALRGEPHDRPPVIPIVGQAGAPLCGVSIYDHAHDPALLARCQVDCARRFGYDGVYISADTWVNAEAIGFPWMEHPVDGPAGGKGTWIESIEDIERLPMPDPGKSGRWPLMVEAVREAVALAGDELLIIANFDQSPFSLACQLRDINEFMIDIYENQELAHRLLAYCAEAVARYAIAMAGAGAHVLNTGDSSAGGSLIGGEWYEQFAFPYEKRVFETIRRKTDVPITLHVCGDTRTCIDKMLETGAEGIEVDEFMDLRLARDKAAERVTVIGNVDPVDPLLQGTPDDVKRKCRACLATFAGSHRFILASGCALSPLTPPENIQAMVEAVEEYS